ncbi:hypothetical protein B0H63DRAFT_282896 [Podospora didyma]|uniref:Uncharacterized protein n=1 Tax=Podospora didyma TaxID=330526 RepID=A0AAE0N5U8_9PEZI|nr:hypothetical protein B0H63DRAFT_282896 [Podospora didyma]
MSSPIPKEKEQKGLGKALSRMKTALRKADPSPRLSTFGGSKGGPSTAAPASTQGVVSSEPAAPEPVVATKKPDPVGSIGVPRSQIFAERAKKFELYGLELKPRDWHSSEGHVLHVKKSIRMRVYRNCHLCDASFGRGMECPKCEHTRCMSCPRFPLRRTDAEREASRLCDRVQTWWPSFYLKERPGGRASI